ISLAAVLVRTIRHATRDVPFKILRPGVARAHLLRLRGLPLEDVAIRRGGLLGILLEAEEAELGADVDSVPRVDEVADLRALRLAPAVAFRGVNGPEGQPERPAHRARLPIVCVEVAVEVPEDERVPYLHRGAEGVDPRANHGRTVRL